LPLLFTISVTNADDCRDSYGYRSQCEKPLGKKLLSFPLILFVPMKKYSLSTAN
jgi:hypothetical protein